MNKKPELLAPAKNFEKLHFAIRYGADAVYLGDAAYSLRAQGKNFTREEIPDAINYAHALGKKVYITANIYPHEDDISGLGEFFQFIAAAGADAVLVSDLGAFSIARDVAPNLPLHVSTQANTLNSAAILAWYRLGAERIVLGRETSYDELKKIRAAIGDVPIELEIFVHGAMCVSYSGRCLLSNFLNGRDGNRGLCTQPCRYRYAVVEETRPGRYFPVEEDAHGTYIFNSCDLALITKIGELRELGIDSLKIEGRNKSVHYVATATNAYRRAVDDYENFRAAGAGNWQPATQLLDELEKISHRRYSLGFFDGNPQQSGQIYESSAYAQTSEFIGIVRECGADGVAVIEQRDNFKAGENIEIFSPDGEIFSQVIEAMNDENGEPIACAPHPQQIVNLKLCKPVPPMTILRRIIKSNFSSLTPNSALRTPN